MKIIIRATINNPNEDLGKLLLIPSRKVFSIFPDVPEINYIIGNMYYFGVGTIYELVFKKATYICEVLEHIPERKSVERISGPGGIKIVSAIYSVHGESAELEYSVEIITKHILSPLKIKKIYMARLKTIINRLQGNNTSIKHLSVHYVLFKTRPPLPAWKYMIVWYMLFYSACISIGLIFGKIIMYGINSFFNWYYGLPS